MAIEYKVDSGLAIITLADSDSGNRLNQKSLEGLDRSLDEALYDKDVRVILLRSNGKNFCLGMDLEFLQSSQGESSLAKKVIGMYVQVLRKIYEAPKPVVAAINGDVKAGGMGLICACDILLASDQSSFELSEVLLGIIPANVLPFLMSRRVSPAQARYLILTAARLSATQALTIGLVDEVHTGEELEKKTRAVVKGLFRAAPHAVASTKKFTSLLWGKDIEEGSRLAQEELLALIQQPEVMAGIAAFNEGGIPEWFGKFKPQDNIL